LGFCELFLERHDIGRQQRRCRRRLGFAPSGGPPIGLLVPDLDDSGRLARRTEPIPQHSAKCSMAHRALESQELSADATQADFWNPAIHVQG
jgi:hypothetical protein